MKLPYIRKTSPREQRQVNTRRALLAVHLFGHLRHAELAHLLWPEAGPDTRAVNASKFLGYLTKEGYLLRRINSFGTHSYVLGLRGAMYAGRQLAEGSKTGARIAGVQGRGFFHRTLGSAWMVDQLLQGHDVYPEFAINSNRYTISRTALVQEWGKLPDGLVLREVLDERGELAHYAADWLEVESTHKGTLQRSRVMDMAWVLGRPLLKDHPIYLDRLVLLYTEDSGHESVLIQTAAAKWQQDGHQVDNPQDLLGSVILTTAKVVPPLAIKSFSSIDLYTFMSRTGQLGELTNPQVLTANQHDFNYSDEDA